MVAWAGVIWTLSSGSFSGERTGEVLLPLLSTLFPHATPGQLDAVHQGLRKLAHFAEYLILSGLLYRALAVERHWSLRAAVLALVLAGTQLAAEAGGRRYASQREKIESFIDAEFGEDVLHLVQRAVAEIV